MECYGRPGVPLMNRACALLVSALRVSTTDAALGDG